MDSLQNDDEYAGRVGGSDIVHDTAPYDSPLLGAPLARGAILIAENEANNRLLMEQILRMHGYQCFTASNGLEVLDLLNHHRVDCVLIDLSMPVLDGYRTTELIRQRPDCEDLPVVAVTAHAMSEDRDLALNSGCTDYLAKPFRQQDLLRIVARMLHHEQA